MKAAALLLMASLIWNASPEPDVINYNIYRGSKSATYTNVVNTGKLATTNQIPWFRSGTTQYFAVTAVNGVAESAFSNEHKYVEPTHPPPVIFVSKGSNNTIKLKWFSVSNAVYRVATKDQLDGQWFGWIERTADLIATTNMMEWSEPMQLNMRLYRVVAY
jgi:hypothetical protein